VVRSGVRPHAGQHGQPGAQAVIRRTLSIEKEERRAMAKHCEICGKTPVVGRQHSHANNVSARRFEPNLQVVRAMINGGVKRIRACTRCIRSGRVTKAA